jgi:hypothetical protein
LIVPLILWLGNLIWQSKLNFVEKISIISSILLLLIILILLWLRKGDKKQKYHYDIFLSYPSSQRQWVEALAKNLQQQGYKIFLDIWKIQGGQDFSKVINKAIQSSRFALLITTPDSSESGWIQREYESLLKQQQENPEFRYIPIILGEFPDSPFLASVQAIDFKDSSKTNYAIAFQYLLCALKNKAPGPNPYFNGALEIPDSIRKEKRGLLQQELSFLEQIFNCLDTGRAVMVLHQADTSSQHYSTALFNKAQQYFGIKQCLKLFPPASSNASTEDYFSRLSTQCGFEAQKLAWKWADALGKRLEQGNPLFVLITGFENGSDAARKDLAGELRGLLDRFPKQLKLVIFGAEKLAAMKYQNGDLSLLNQLEEKRLPELSVPDLQYLFAQHYPQLKQQNLTELFQLTGQNPRLIQACLQNNAYSSHECKNYLNNSSLPSQLFSRFQTDNKPQLCLYLQQQELCNYNPWPQDKLVRKLYWNNLIKRSKNKLIWRSDYIQKIGQQSLECDS